jgi:hypothetical protein
LLVSFYPSYRTSTYMFFLFFLLLFLSIFFIFSFPTVIVLTPFLASKSFLLSSFYISLILCFSFFSLLFLFISLLRLSLLFLVLN